MSFVLISDIHYSASVSFISDMVKPPVKPRRYVVSANFAVVGGLPPLLYPVDIASGLVFNLSES